MKISILFSAYSCFIFLLTLSACKQSNYSVIQGNSNGSTTGASNGGASSGGGGGTPLSINWKFIDGGFDTGINYSSSRSADSMDLSWAELNSKLYISWTEADSSFRKKVRIAVYNNNDNSPAWTHVGGGSSGLSFNSNRDADQSRLEVLNSKLYAAWTEFGASNTTSSIRVFVFNGNDSSPSWASVDGGGSNGLAYNTSNNASDFDLISFNNKLYVFWREQDEGPTTFVRIRAKVYNGNDSSPSWSWVDGGGASGLNFNNSQSAVQPKAVVLNSKLYLLWNEYNGTTSAQLRVAVYNGNDSTPSWSFVDGNGLNGINWQSSRSTNWKDAIVANSKLYVTWQEHSGSNWTIRAANYNGNDLSPSWTFIDGSIQGGLNYLPNHEAISPSITSDGSNILIAWTEFGEIMVKSLDISSLNSSWQFQDNGGNGLNYNSSPSPSGSAPGIAFWNNRFFLGWNEYLPSCSCMQYRMRVGIK